MQGTKTIGDVDVTFQELGVVQFCALRKDGVWHVMALVEMGDSEKNQITAECGESLSKATRNLIQTIKDLKGYGQ